VGRYEVRAGLVDNHGDILTREHAARVCKHDNEHEVDAETRVLKDPRNLALGEFDVSLVEFLGVGTTSGPELAENPPLVVGLDAELGGECERSYRWPRQMYRHGPAGKAERGRSSRQWRQYRRPSLSGAGFELGVSFSLA
jgi:hypothetical protein